MRDIISSAIKESLDLRATILSDDKVIASIESASKKLIETSKSGGTIYMCGNGGSACDAIHFCEELVARYKADRPGIKAQHFMDPATITCWANDYEFESIFERQVKTFCGPKDCLVLFSTSGNSENIVRAANAARTSGTNVLGLLGKDGGKVLSLCVLAIVVPSIETARIQEVHITLVHIFCEIIDKAFAN